MRTDQGGTMTPYQITDAELDELGETVFNDDYLRGELLRLRGGCYCPFGPPCHACTEPLTAGEAIDL